MLTIRDLRKSMGGRTLFEDAAMTVNYGERVALVGPNGAGKSTLFNLILKKDTADAGTIERDEWTMVGYLPQESEPVGEETVLDVATGRAGEIAALGEAAARAGKSRRRQRRRISRSHAKHEALSDPQVDAKAKKMLARPRLPRVGLQPQGERDERRLGHARASRAAARHGARSAVLDEPTNHLDLLSLLWLQNYLKNYSGALLLISHDRQFMDEVVEACLRDRGAEADRVTPATTPTSFGSAKRTTSSSSPPTITSRRKSRGSANSTTASARSPRKLRRP